MNQIIMWLIDRYVAGDPAYSRLRLASRTLLAVLLSIAALYMMAFVHPMPIACYGLAIFLAFSGSISVRDPDWRAQATTRALAGVAGAGTAILACSLAASPKYAIATFLAVIFGSAYVRCYGMRWLTVGMASFMGYFMGDYFHPSPLEAIWLVPSSAIAMAASQICATVLLPDDAERDFRRALLAVDRRIVIMLRYLHQLAVVGALPATDQKHVRSQLSQLRDTVLMTEGLIPQITNGGWDIEGPAATLASSLFDLQLAVERLVRYRRTALPPAEALQAFLRYFQSGSVPPPALDGPRDDGTTTALILLRDVLRLRTRVSAVLGASPSVAFSRPAPILAKTPSTTTYATTTERSAFIPVTLHRPIQITLACGIAIAGGASLSSSRWYWAVVTAYIVFNNTKTRADAALRAFQRSAGTIGGVFVGLLLAALLHGHAIATGLLLPAVLFLAVYSLQASYSWMIFFITIGLALLYGLLGTFSPQLLFLRILETMIGSTAGVASAFLVFPSRTTNSIASVLNSFLNELETLVGFAYSRQGGVGSAPAIIAASRRLDRRYSELVVAVKPLAGPWTVVTRFGQVREKLLLLVTCAYWARSAANALQKMSHDGSASQQRAVALIQSIKARIRQMTSMSSDWFSDALVPEELPIPDPASIRATEHQEELVVALTMIDELLEIAVAASEPRQAPRS